MLQQTDKVLLAVTLGEFIGMKMNGFFEDMNEHAQKCGLNPSKSERDSWKANGNRH